MGNFTRVPNVEVEAEPDRRHGFSAYLEDGPGWIRPFITVGQSDSAIMLEYEDAEILCDWLCRALHRPSIGWWYAVCCVEDLKQITSGEELEDALDIKRTLPQTKFWPTRADAVKELGTSPHQEGADHG